MTVTDNVRKLKANAFAMAKMIYQSNAGQRKDGDNNICWGGKKNPIIDFCIYAIACDTAKIINSGFLENINLERSKKIPTAAEMESAHFDLRKDESVKLRQYLIGNGFDFDLDTLKNLAHKWRHRIFDDTPSDVAKNAPFEYPNSSQGVMYRLAMEGMALVFSGKV